MRNGDETAFTELYARHHAVARRVASTYRCGTDADDLVNEAFEKVLGALRRGHGPTDAFRAYLFVTMRRMAAESAERPLDEPLDEVPDPVVAVAAADPLAAEDREMIVTAFGSLPERWQTVLWHTAVEGRKPGDLAGALGMSANAVSALAYRAREQLRQAYLQAHLRVSPRPQCEPHRSMLGAYVRDGLSRRERAATENHLAHCSSCHLLVGELTEVNQLLVRAVVPLFLGLPVQGIAASAAAVTAGTTAAAHFSTAAGAGAGAAGAATDPSTVRRVLGSVAWARDAVSTAAGLAAAAAVVVGLAAGTLVLRRDPGERPPPTPPAGESAAAADGDATSTPTTTTPDNLSGSASPSCAVLAGSAIDGAANAGAADAGADPSPSSSTTAPGAGSSGSSGTSDPANPARGSADGSESGTRSGTGSGDAPLSLGGLLASLLGADAAADAGVPDDADTPVPSSSTSARLTDPSCISHAGGGKLTVGVTNPDEPAVSVDAPAAIDSTVDKVEDAGVAIEAEVLDAVSLEVELDDGVTALELNLPPGCEIDEEDRSIVSCLVGNLLPGTSASATLDLGLDGDGGGATITVKSGDTVIDVQALDLLPALSDLTNGLTGGGTSTSSTGSTSSTSSTGSTGSGSG